MFLTASSQHQLSKPWHQVSGLGADGSGRSSEITLIRLFWPTSGLPDLMRLSPPPPSPSHLQLLFCPFAPIRSLLSVVIDHLSTPTPGATPLKLFSSNLLSLQFFQFTLRIAQLLNGSPSFQSNFVLFHFTTICFAILRSTTKTQCHPGVATSASADHCARYRICRRILLWCVIGLVFPLSSFATVSPHYDLHYT